MGIKGHVAIELKNVETGKVERIEKHNLVTSALDEFLDYCGIALLANTLSTEVNSTSVYRPNMIPARQYLLGNLLLFSTPTAENRKYLSLELDDILGWAKQTLSEETNQGSYNTSESGRLETGYKHVWDFTTSQCNGVIASLSLTNAYMNNLHACTPIRLTTNTFSTAGTKGLFYLTDAYVYSYSYDSSARKITFYRHNNKLKSLKVAETPSIEQTDPDVQEMGTYTIPQEVGVVSLRSITTKNSENKTYWTLGYTNSNHTSTVILALDMTNFSTSTFTVTTPHGAYEAKYKNGYLFYYVSGYGFYRYNISTQVEEQVVEASWYTSFGANMHDSYDQEDTAFICGYGNRNAWYVKSDGTALDFADEKYAPEVILKSNCLWVPANSSTSQSGIPVKNEIDLNTSYLGTIFNLSSPITKTAAQTMKIIYTLTDA